MGTRGAELVVEQGREAGRVIRLAEPGAVLGRGGTTAGERVALEEPDVSRQHVRVERGAQGWTVTDLGSTNGTFVNGQRLPAHEPYALQDGDRLGLGGATLVFQEGGPSLGLPQGGRGGRKTSRSSPEGRRGGGEPSLGVPQEGRRGKGALVAAAVVLVLVVVVLVVVLVVLLRPATAVVTPTAGNPVQEIMTALPVPTELQDVATAVIPLIPTVLEPLLGGGGTPTP